MRLSFCQSQSLRGGQVIKLEMEARGSLLFRVFFWSQINHVSWCVIKDQRVCTKIHFMTQHTGELEGWAGNMELF